MITPFLKRVFALLLVLFLIPACGGSPGGGGGNGGAHTLKAVVLSGPQEVPAVSTTATGDATLEVDANHTQISVTLNVSGLSNITEAHVHVGPPQQDGDIIFVLSSGSFTSPLTRTLTSADLVPSPGAGINTFSDAVNAVIDGKTYVNVHTLAHSGGEIRGQVGPVPLKASLNGTQETPPVSTSATGTMTLKFNDDQSSFTLTLKTYGLMNATDAHIHVGAIGVPGPIIFSLASGSVPSTLHLTVTSTDLTQQPGSGINNFNDAVDAMLSGNTYVNVHTVAHSGGEIRGQIGP